VASRGAERRPKPTGGWSGVLHETARLTDSGGSRLYDPTVAGRFVFAGSSAGVDVFEKPAGGWSGVLHQVGKLITPHDYPLGSLAVSGRTLVASLNLGVYVFTEPHRGWSGIVHPAAKLALKSSGAYPYSFTDAISGQTIAAAAYDLGPEHDCPSSSSRATITVPESTDCTRAPSRSAADQRPSQSPRTRTARRGRPPRASSFTVPAATNRPWSTIATSSHKCSTR